MHESEVNGIKREIEQLVKARKDMRMVAEQAALFEGNEFIPVASIESTDMVVAYCRGYSTDGERRVPITASLLPPEGDEFFSSTVSDLLALRDRVLAHSDETSNRIAADPFGEHRYTEGYRHWNPNVFAKIAELARAQRAALRRRAEPASRQAEIAARRAPGRRSVVDLVPARRASRARTSSDARWVSARATRPPRRPGRLALRPGCFTRFGRMLSHRDVENTKLQIAA